MLKIAYQGVPGAYSHIACGELFPNQDYVACDTFEIAMEMVKNGTVDKAVIPVVPVIETIRKLNDAEGSETVPRSDYRLVQTPQVFEVATLKHAYEQPYIDTFTDDASVVEAMGIPVALAEGNRENIKITTQFDLRIAEALT